MRILSVVCVVGSTVALAGCAGSGVETRVETDRAKTQSVDETEPLEPVAKARCDEDGNSAYASEAEFPAPATISELSTLSDAVVRLTSADDEYLVTMTGDDVNGSQFWARKMIVADVLAGDGPKQGTTIQVVRVCPVFTVKVLTPDGERQQPGIPDEGYPGPLDGTNYVVGIVALPDFGVDHFGIAAGENGVIAIRSDGSDGFTVEEPQLGADGLMQRSAAGNPLSKLQQ